jgi:hypothetical protein
MIDGSGKTAGVFVRCNAINKKANSQPVAPP